MTNEEENKKEAPVNKAINAASEVVFLQDKLKEKRAKIEELNLIIKNLNTLPDGNKILKNKISQKEGSLCDLIKNRYEAKEYLFLDEYTSRLKHLLEPFKEPEEDEKEEGSKKKEEKAIKGKED